MTNEWSRWALVPLAVFLALSATSVAWLWIDEAPLIYDPSAHLFGALLFDSTPGVYLSEERQFYPPLVHILVATGLALSDYNIDIAIGVVALLFLGVLLCSTYAIGARLWSPRVGACAVILISLYPATYIHSRSLLLDLPLMAMTACAVWMLLCSRRFTDPGWSLAFGVACAVGLLTKQAFAAVMLLPVAYEVLRWPWRAPGLLALVLAAAPVIAVVAWWYVPRLDWFLGDYREIQESYARGRGDPETMSAFGLSYYLIGTWHQTALPFAVLWVATIVLFLKAPSRGLLLWWWAGVVLSSTALVLKDSRFLMPALPAIALMTAVGLDRLRNGTIVLGAMVVFGALQLYAASFGSSFLPEGSVITNRVERNEDIQDFAQHWRMTGADTSVADASGWGGAAEGLRGLEAARVAVVADRVVFVAARNPKLATSEVYAADVAVEALKCADRVRFRQFEFVIIQIGGEFGVSLQDYTACTTGLIEDRRIPIDLPRLLPGVSQLVVFRTSPP